MNQWDRTDKMDTIIAQVATGGNETIVGETRLYELANSGVDLSLAAELVYMDFAQLDEKIATALPADTVAHIRQLYQQIVRFRNL